MDKPTMTRIRARGKPGRPRSPDTCSHCGAPPSQQRARLASPPPAESCGPCEPTTRYLIAVCELPSGGRRAYYAHSAANARAARAAIARDPGLLAALCAAADTFEDS